MTDHPDSIKRHPLNMRTTRRTRELLEQAARDSGRSLAQEVEFRLEQSFQSEEVASVFQDEVYGRQLAALLAMIGRAMREAGVLGSIWSGKRAPYAHFDWMTDPTAFSVAKRVALEVLKAFPSDDDAAAQLPIPAAELAAAIVEAAKAPADGRTAVLRDWGEHVHGRLGELAARLTLDPSVGRAVAALARIPGDLPEDEP